MASLLSSLTVWHWLILGVVLMAIETLIPGAFFLWLGLAAILTGLLTWAVEMPWTIAVGIWAALSVISVVSWTTYRKKHPKSETSSGLNQRGQEFTGQVFTLDKPVINGKGEIRAGDTIWKILCNQDLSAGTQIRVTGLDGTALRVVPNV